MQHSELEPELLEPGQPHTIGAKIKTLAENLGALSL